MKPVLKYPGAKWRIADWIISHMPEHHTYLEPFFGSGAVFFKKQRSRIETVNDLDGNVVNLFKVIRSHPEELAYQVAHTPWSRDEYYESYTKTGDPIEDARRFMVRIWQAHGAKLSDRTGWRNNIIEDCGGTKNWHNRLPRDLLLISERLKNVQIENQPAVKLIGRYNTPGTLIYADPPYVLSTRSNRMYAHEMTDADHVELLDALKRHSGPVIISGYESDLYAQMLKGWSVAQIPALAQGGVKRSDVIWLNEYAQVSQIKMNEVMV